MLSCREVWPWEQEGGPWKRGEHVAMQFVAIVGGGGGWRARKSLSNDIDDFGQQSRWRSFSF